MKLGVTAFLVVALCGLALAPETSAQDPEQGKAVYESRCVICHGDQGDGRGLIGIVHRAQTNGLVVTVYPRDFTAGVFKFRSTPSGFLPTDDDLMRIVTEGISRSGMPSHTDLSEADRRNVIAYIKTFSPRWEQDEPGEPFVIAGPPEFVDSAQSADRGAEVYQTMQGSRRTANDPKTGGVPTRILPVLYFAVARVALASAFAAVALDPLAVAGFFYHARIVAIVHLVTLG